MPRHARVRGAIVHRAARLTSADLAVVRGLPTTTPARAVIDLAGRLSEDDLRAVLNHCTGKRLALPTTIRRRLEALGSNRPGGPMLADLLRGRLDTDRVPDGVFEHRLLELLSTLPGPPPVPQYHLVEPDGRDRWLDAAYPDERFGVEAQSYEYHADLEPWARDLTRAVPLLGLGWVIFPVTWFDLTERPDWWLRHLQAGAGEPVTRIRRSATDSGHSLGRAAMARSPHHVQRR